MENINSLLEAKGVVEELRSQDKLNPAMEAYLKRSHPTLLGGVDIREEVLEDLLQLGTENPSLTPRAEFVPEPERKRSKWSRFLKPVAVGASLLATAVSGYLIAKDDANTPHLANPILDLDTEPMYAAAEDQASFFLQVNDSVEVYGNRLKLNDVSNSTTCTISVDVDGTSEVITTEFKPVEDLEVAADECFWTQLRENRAAIILVKGQGQAQQNNVTEYEGFTKEELSNLNVFAADNYETTYKYDSSNTISNKNRLPENSEITLELGRFDYYSPAGSSSTNNEATFDAWYVNLSSEGSTSSRLNNNWHYDEMGVVIWIDKYDLDQVYVGLADGSAYEQVGLNSEKEITWYQPDKSISHSARLYVPQDAEISGDLDLSFRSSYHADSKEVAVGQGGLFSIGNITNLPVSVWDVDVDNDTIDIRIGDSQYLTLNANERHNLVPGGEIYLEVYAYDESAAFINLRAEDDLEFVLEQTDSEFDGALQANFNGELVEGGEYLESATGENVSIETNGEKGSLYLPRADMRTPNVWSSWEQKDDQLEVNFGARDYESNLTKVEVKVAKEDGTEQIIAIYNVTGDVFENSVSIPLVGPNGIGLGDHDLSIIAEDEHSNMGSRAIGIYVGKPDTDYSGLEATLEDHLLILNGVVKNAIGNQSYSIMREGEQVAQGTFEIKSRGSVLEVIDLSGFDAGTYEVLFDDFKTEADAKAMFFNTMHFSENNTQEYESLDVRLLEHNEDNATLRFRDRSTGAEEVVVLNASTNFGWTSDNAQDMFDGYEGQEIMGMVASYVRNSTYQTYDWDLEDWVEVRAVELQFGKKYNLSVGETANGFWEQQHTFVDLIDGPFGNSTGKIVQTEERMWERTYLDKSVGVFKYQPGMLFDVDSENATEVQQKLSFDLDDFVSGPDDHYDDGYDDGHDEGYNEGHGEGYGEGFDDGNRTGYANGEAVGKEEGYGDGWEDGEDAGFENGTEYGHGNGLEEGLGLGREEGYNEGVNDTEDSYLKKLAEEKQKELLIAAGLLPALGLGYIIGRRGRTYRVAADRNGNKLQVLHSVDDLFEGDDPELEDVYVANEPTPESYAEVHDMFEGSETIDAPAVDIHSFDRWIPGKTRAQKKLKAKGYDSMAKLQEAVEEYEGSAYVFLLSEIGFSEKAAKGVKRKLNNWEAENSLDELEE